VSSLASTCLGKVQVPGCNNITNAAFFFQPGMPVLACHLCFFTRHRVAHSATSRCDNWGKDALLWALGWTIFHLKQFGFAALKHTKGEDTVDVFKQFVSHKPKGFTEETHLSWTCHSWPIVVGSSRTVTPSRAIILLFERDPISPALFPNHNNISAACPCGPGLIFTDTTSFIVFNSIACSPQHRLQKSVSRHSGACEQWETLTLLWNSSQRAKHHSAHTCHSLRPERCPLQFSWLRSQCSHDHVGFWCGRECTTPRHSQILEHG